MRHPVPNADNEGTPLWLNVGAGPHGLPNFVNLDNHPFLRAAPLFPWLKRMAQASNLASSLAPKLDWIGAYHQSMHATRYVQVDCRKPLPYPADSVDHILCSHFLEHVYRSEAETIVHGFFRALRPGGTAHLIVPDLRRQVDAYLQPTDVQPEHAADQFLRETLLASANTRSLPYRALELLGFEGLQHRWMYDQASLEALATTAGFELLDTNDTPSASIRLDDGESVHVVARKPRH